MKQKIGILVPQLNKATTGGQKYDFYLVNQLKQNNVDIINITDDTLLYSKVNLSIFYNLIYFLDRKIFKQVNILIINSRLYPRLFLFIKLLKKINRRIQIISIHHHYNYQTKTGFLRIIHKILELSFLKKCDAIIAPSPYCKGETETLFPNKTIYFLEIAFPPKELDFNSFKKESNYFLFIGNIEKRKGIDLLIETLQIVKKEHANFKMIIVGKYDKKDKYYQRIEEKIIKYRLENNIKFVGRVSDEELEEYKKKAELFLFPSLHEGYGMVLAEVMYYGIPVIAFDNSAIPYMIKDGYNGMLAKNMDIKSFANAITKLINSPKSIEELRNNCYKTAQEIRTYEELNEDIKKFVDNLAV